MRLEYVTHPRGQYRARGAAASLPYAHKKYYLIIKYRFFFFKFMHMRYLSERIFE